MEKAEVIGHGIGWSDFVYYSDGTKKVTKMFKSKPGNIHEAMAEMRKRLNKIGNNRMFVNAALWAMTYGFVVRLLIEV